MEIPDGEYDIDLSVFGDGRSASEGVPPSIAIRYGFIPDSMDQSSRLTLFQDDGVCILEASSSGDSKTGGRSLPIIFEGVPQRQRAAPNSFSSASDSYFLAFSPAEPPASQKLKVQLRRLESTIRVSKSRNAQKWRASIKEWQTNTTDELNGFPKPEPQIAVSPNKASKKKPAGLDQKQKKDEGRPLASGGKRTLTRKSAAKRPPTATPDLSNEIISVSDFEDLGSDDETALFEKSVPKQDLQQPSKKAYNNKDVVPKNEKPSGPGERASLSGQSAAHATMDDDFADLEDQLHEVLDDRAAPKEEVSSDSDEDTNRRRFIGAPIVIDTNGERDVRSKSNTQKYNSKGKPMSLRELYGGDRTDYISSSEEE